MRPLHLVLDTSAVLAYARGDANVGEPLTQVAENGAAFTVPMSVLATAATQADASWMSLLTKHAAFEPIKLEWEQWPALSATLGMVQHLDTAEALLLALRANCEVLTAEPDLYAAMGDDPPIIEV